MLESASAATDLDLICYLKQEGKARLFRRFFRKLLIGPGSCSPWRTSSGISSPAMPLPSSCAIPVAAESEIGMVWSGERGSAPTRVTDQPTHSPAEALSNGPSAPATPVLSSGIYTAWRDAALSTFIEQREIRWMTNICRSACRINQQ